jgi:putative transposase
MRFCEGVGVFCPGGARPSVQAMIAFIDDHRKAYGPSSMCKLLPIARPPNMPSPHVGRIPARPGPRARRCGAATCDPADEENFRVYGVRKVWRQLHR